VAVPALPTSPAVELRVQPTYQFPIWKITDHKWKQVILVANFLFGSRVNEILKKTFILDSHQPFIGSAIQYVCSNILEPNRNIRKKGANA
jgi:hypothetical protein